MRSRNGKCSVDDEASDAEIGRHRGLRYPSMEDPMVLVVQPPVCLVSRLYAIHIDKYSHVEMSRDDRASLVRRKNVDDDATRCKLRVAYRPFDALRSS